MLYWLFAAKVVQGKEIRGLVIWNLAFSKIPVPCMSDLTSRRLGSYTRVGSDGFTTFRSLLLLYCTAGPPVNILLRSIQDKCKDGWMIYCPPHGSPQRTPELPLFPVWSTGSKYVRTDTRPSYARFPSSRIIPTLVEDL